MRHYSHSYRSQDLFCHLGHSMKFGDVRLAFYVSGFHWTSDKYSSTDIHHCFLVRTIKWTNLGRSKQSLPYCTTTMQKPSRLGSAHVHAYEYASRCTYMQKSRLSSSTITVNIRRCPSSPHHFRLRSFSFSFFHLFISGAFLRTFWSFVLTF